MDTQSHFRDSMPLIQLYRKIQKGVVCRPHNEKHIEVPAENNRRETPGERRIRESSHVLEDCRWKRGREDDLGPVHTCSGREPDSSVPGARVRFVFTRDKNRPAAIGSHPVKLKRHVHIATGTRTVLT